MTGSSLDQGNEPFCKSGLGSRGTGEPKYKYIIWKKCVKTISTQWGNLNVELGLTVEISDAVECLQWSDRVYCVLCTRVCQEKALKMQHKRWKSPALRITIGISIK